MSTSDPMRWSQLWSCCETDRAVMPVQLIVASYFSVFFVSCESLIAYKLTLYCERRHQCALPFLPLLPDRRCGITNKIPLSAEPDWHRSSRHRQWQTLQSGHSSCSHFFFILQSRLIYRRPPYTINLILVMLSLRPIAFICRKMQGKEAISRWRTLKGQLNTAAPRAGMAGIVRAATAQQADRQHGSAALQPVAEDPSEGANGFADDEGTAVGSLDSKAISIPERAVSIGACHYYYYYHH